MRWVASELLRKGGGGCRTEDEGLTAKYVERAAVSFYTLIILLFFSLTFNKVIQLGLSARPPEVVSQ